MTLPPTLKVRYAPIPTFEWNFTRLEGDSKMVFEWRSNLIMILRNDIFSFLWSKLVLLPNLSLEPVKFFFALIFGAILVLDNSTDTKLVIPGNA